MVVIDSTVVKAVKKHYEDKYKDLKDDEKKKKIEGHLKAMVSDSGGGISGSNMSSMGYSFDADEKKEIDKKINESGYRIVYDSFSEGLEPIYFWVLDWMRDTYWGLGADVEKTIDQFEAAAGSGFFGDLGTRGSIMQDRAMKLLGTINTVTRSVINILYDLKEFDQRLQLYKDLKDDDKKENARLSLKQFWMDKVDVQRGRGSINMMAQQLQFVTLRDAFMAAENEKLELNGRVMDLNERVKRILGPRMADYLTWERLSGKELERRYKIERNYLKSQIESLKLYGQWAKPYFQAAKRLNSEVSRSPDLVTTFNTLQVQASLLGTKKQGDFFMAVEATFDFRTIPHTMRQSQAGVHYTQGGRVDMQFRGFALNADEKKAVEEYELHEAFEMANLGDDIIKEVEESLKDYFEGEDKEFEDPRERLGFLQEFVETIDDKKLRKNVVKDIEKLKDKIKKEDKAKSPGPLQALGENFKGVPEFIKKISKNTVERVEGEDRSDVAKSSNQSAYAVYLVYKKAHGMYTE